MKTMTMNTRLSNTFSFARVGAALLTGGLAVGCDAPIDEDALEADLAAEDELADEFEDAEDVEDDEDEDEAAPRDLKAPEVPVLPLVGNGFTVHGWGTTNDAVGIDIGSISDRRCVLSGVAGNLNQGQQPGFGGGTLSLPATAAVFVDSTAPAHYQLIAHGGAWQNNNNQRSWANDPVSAQATCFWETTLGGSGTWESGRAPLKIASLSAPNSRVRQCFLTGIEGVDGTWNSSTRYARVLEYTVADATHPTVGWYVEGNLPTDPVHGSRAAVSASCIDFPQGTGINVGQTSAAVGGTMTHTMAWGSGIKACALTGIEGALNVDSYTDGALTNFPATIDGNWTITVKNNKTATWACAR